MANTLPLLSSMRVTYIGSTRMPLLGNVVYASTISCTLTSHGPKQRLTTGSKGPSMPNERIMRTNCSGVKRDIKYAVIQLLDFSNPQLSVTISPWFLV